MVGPANAYQNKPTLSEDEQLQVEKEATPLVDTPRKDIMKVIEKIFALKLSSEQMSTLELCIYNGAIRESLWCAVPCLKAPAPQSPQSFPPTHP